MKPEKRSEDKSLDRNRKMKISRLIFTALTLLAFTGFISACSATGLVGEGDGSYQESLSFDLLLKNGKVLDGTGNPWFYADIGINDDRIVWIGKSDNAEGGEVIDAAGLYISPGFIDVHSHASSGLSSESLSHGQPLLALCSAGLINNDHQ